MGHPPIENASETKEDTERKEGKQETTTQQLSNSTAALAAWEPLPREAVHWPTRAGPPGPKAYLLHAIRCGGMTGILRILNKWPKHARNVEESLW